ncbi:MAG: hypothetical protein ACJ79S_17725 [Gemmatimonadaceae bacterium]
MRTAPESRGETAIAPTPSAGRAEVLAEALGCIITGRPLPESVRAPSYEAVRPATVEVGIAWIIAGPGSSIR